MSTPPSDEPGSSPTPSSRPTFIILVLGLAFLSSFMILRRFASNHPARGSRADYSWKLADLDGKPVELKDYKGRAIFLNVWATWCGPCMMEMPSIAKLAANPKLKDVAFLCISSESPEPVRAYVERTKPPMTMLLAAEETPRVFSTEGIPATFFIAPDGRIVRSEVGSNDWDDPQVVSLLEKLAKDTK